MWEEYDITPFIVLMHTHFILYIVRILDIYEMDIPALSGKYDVFKLKLWSTELFLKPVIYNM